MSTVLEKVVGRHPQTLTIDVPIENDIVISDDLAVPAGIVDLTSFREWAHSDDFPERYRIDYQHGTIIVDLSMEQAYSHNGVKTPFIGTLEKLLEIEDIGQLYGDRMRISLPASDASCEPDGMFILYESLRSGKVVRKPGRHGGVLEFVGVPDLLLEVVSDSSEELDKSSRPDEYRRAGVAEFWRVDARGDSIVFELFILVDGAYLLAEEKDGWQRSNVLAKWFRFERNYDLVGDPRFHLRMKD